MTDRNRTEMHDDTPAALLLALRGMRREEHPRRELWRGIAARVGGDVRGQPRPAGLRTRWPMASFAAVATLALALGIGWRAAHLPGPGEPSETAGPSLLVQEAEALDREYDGALREALAARRDHPVADAGADLGMLDRSAAEIRAALLLDPDATFLLDQLQRVRARRLELALDLPRLP